MDSSQRWGGIVSPHMKAFQFCVKLSKRYNFYAIPALFVVLLAESAGVSLSYVMKEVVDALTESTGTVWS